MSDKIISKSLLTFLETPGAKEREATGKALGVTAAKSSHPKHRRS